MIDPSAPFLLLDDARENGAGPSLLYAKPIAIIEARTLDEVRPSLARVRQGLADGLHAGGYLSYEAGYALERRLAALSAAPADGAPPFLWFGLFDRAETVDDVQALLPDPRSGWCGAARPLIDQADYRRSVARIHEHILAGDLYQANLTFPAEVRTAGSPLALYAALRRRARAGHGALVFTGEHWLLSCSPELFFTLSEGRILARPMKGTAVRRLDPAADEAEAAALRADPKQRAENLMIVDLLRNDLSRVCRAGTVEVPSLFEVETYPTVHQMTSTVTASLAGGLDAIDVLEAIFPCGSITGAPKMRAMEIIAGIEMAPRNVYTGAIGRLEPDGDAWFNVAIRTISLRAGESRGIIGLGSGLVADSRADDEWRECLAKGVFVHDQSRRFDLVETMRFDPHDGIFELERHLLRLKDSAEAFGFIFDRHAARNELQAATFRLREPRKLRLRLSPTGAISIEARSMPEVPGEPVEVAVLPLPVAQDDFRLRHKTSDRAFYDEARKGAGTFEVVFVDPSGFLTEGSFTNIFVERDGRLLTPPAARGLLPGILRARLIAEGKAAEQDLLASDLTGGFFVGNAVRGLVRARLRD